MTEVEARSIAQQLAYLDPEDVDYILGAASEEEAQWLIKYWPFWSRGGQRAPDGIWRSWLVLAGRGFGKTRSGAEWVRAFAGQNGRTRIALVAATMAEARMVMVEGESGVLEISQGDDRPNWEPSLGRLTWPNHAEAHLYSAAEPDSLRGASFHAAWADEIGKWAKGTAAWDNMMLGLRLGDFPRAVATTTPRRVPLIRRLLSDPRCAVTRGRTLDNCGNLGDGFVDAIRAEHEGTRFGRQELDGELLEDVEGSLWPRALIEECRVPAMTPGKARETMRRIVVAVDPPAGANKDSDACGIIVAGLGEADAGFVLADASVQGARPEVWARAVATQYETWQADRIVAEANQGGEMVRSVLAAAGRNLPVRLRHARRSKSARAEPVAALYEMGKVCHAGAFPALEDELAAMTIGGQYEGAGRSPDRMDALVWALAELLLEGGREPRVRGL